MREPERLRVIGVEESRAPIDVSVVVPVHDGPRDLVPLYEEYSRPLVASGRSFEFIFVSTPNGTRRIEDLAPLIRRHAPVRVLEAAHDLNETGLLRRGFADARGEVLLTLPPTRQVEPSAIEPILAAVEAGSEVAVGCRWPRADAAINRAQSWVLHRIARGLRGGDFHDLGCGVRAMRRAVAAELPLYGELARFFPLLAQHHGFSVEEVRVPQHPTDRGLRIHGPGIYVRRLLDLLGLFFVLRFTDRPLRFFGLFGALLTLLGTIAMGILVLNRFQGTPMGTRPMLLVAVFCLALGVQSIAFGLIGEMIVHFNARRGRAYRVKEIRERVRS